MSAFIGAGWMVVGLIGLTYRTFAAWQTWTSLSDYTAVLLTFGPWGVASMVAIAAGTGILARRNWARVTAAILSPVVMILAIFFLATLPLYRPGTLTSGTVLRAVIDAILTIPLGTYTLYWFFKGRRPVKGKA